MTSASNQRFLVVVVPPLPGVSCPPSTGQEGMGYDGELTPGKEGFAVVADTKTGKVRIVADKYGHTEFDFGAA